MKGEAEAEHLVLGVRQEVWSHHSNVQEGYEPIRAAEARGPGRPGEARLEQERIS